MSQRIGDMTRAEYVAAVREAGFIHDGGKLCDPATGVSYEPILVRGHRGREVHRRATLAAAIRRREDGRNPRL